MTDSAFGTQAVVAPSELPAVEQYEFTPRQEAFIVAYMSLRNATKAALQAGYSPAGASCEANRLLSNPRIRTEIDRRLKSVGWSRDKVFFELNDGYECAKAEKNLKERREFALFMAKMMGYLQDGANVVVNVLTQVVDDARKSIRNKEL